MITVWERRKQIKQLRREVSIYFVVGVLLLYMCGAFAATAAYQAGMRVLAAWLGYVMCLVWAYLAFDFFFSTHRKLKALEAE